jgi:hypothetical protein
MVSMANITLRDRGILGTVPGTFHAFDVFEPNAPITIRFRAALGNAVKGALRAHSRNHRRV